MEVFRVLHRDEKVTNKAVCRLCTKQLSYPTKTANVYNLVWLPTTRHTQLQEAPCQQLIGKIARFICKDMQPIGIIISGEGFWDLMMELELNVVWCSFHTCSNLIFFKMTALGGDFNFCLDAVLDRSFDRPYLLSKSAKTAISFMRDLNLMMSGGRCIHRIETIHFIYILTILIPV